MKKFFVLLIALFIANSSTAQTSQPCSTCLPEGITFTTQAQIDNFQTNYPGCTEILGHLTIDGNDINNLNGLNVLASIGNALLITSNPALTSLTGLENLTSIGGNLSICGNHALSNLTGLESLISIGGSLTITGDNLLLSLTGLEGVTSIGGNVVIANGNSLTSLSGLEGLTFIPGYLQIQNISTLTSLSGLEGLTSIGGNLSISNNNSLTSLTGLENLTSIEGYIKIGEQGGGNPLLTSLTGLDNINAGSITELYIIDNHSLSTCEVQSICDFLAAPNRTVEIHDNATGCNSTEEVEVACGLYCLPDGITFSTQTQIENFQTNYPGCTKIAGDVIINGYYITDLDGLNVLTSVRGNLSIYVNNYLTSLTGLEGLTSIGSDLIIYGNTELTSLTGLDNLTSIGGSLRIGDFYYGNLALSSLTGLEGLISIGGALEIGWSDTLTSLTGLESLTSIGGDLNIYANTALTSLTGLDNLTSIGGNLRIGDFDHGNLVLSSLTGLESLTSIGSDLIIYGNTDLTSLSGLEGLTSIGGYLIIWFNNALISLTGLEGLTSIGEDLNIHDNEVLTSLTGLDNIEANTISNLFIGGNPSLSTCAVQSVCDYLAAPHGTVEIYDNAIGCNSEVEVDSACVYLSNGDVKPQPAFSIYPNPSSTTITISTPTTPIKNTYMTIYYINGQQIISRQITEQKIIVDVSMLSQGVYFVKVVSDDGVSVGKMVKE